MQIGILGVGNIGATLTARPARGHPRHAPLTSARAACGQAWSMQVRAAGRACRRASPIGAPQTSQRP
ncbi:hypothetical protein GCM10023162_40030 [Klenkia terrae]